MSRRFAFVFLILLPLSAWSDDVAPTQAIKTQIEAFQADDFAAAFEIASPNIQSVFKNPDNFGRMVRNGFPMVWRPKRVQFLDQRMINGQEWQLVQIEDFAGEFHYLDYQMIKINDEWRINAVQIVPSPSVSA